MGLALVKRFVEMHGGEVRVESKQVFAGKVLIEENLKVIEWRPSKKTGSTSPGLEIGK